MSYTIFFKINGCCIPNNGNIGYKDVDWCRNWIKVTKRFLVNLNVWCDFKYAYSDWWTDVTDWNGNPWLWEDKPCVTPRDSEITCVEENDQLYRLSFDTLTNDWKVLDFNTPPNDVTWTVTPVKCARDLESDPVILYDNCNPFYRWIVKEDGKPNWVFWDTELDWQPYAVVWVVTEYPCSGPASLDTSVSNIGPWATVSYIPTTCVKSVSIWQNSWNLLTASFTFTWSVAWNNEQTIPWRWVTNYEAPQGTCITQIDILNPDLVNPVIVYINAMS